MTDEERLKALRSALHRVLCVADWCRTAGLLNVGADMNAAKLELEQVIYSFAGNK